MLAFARALDYKSAGMRASLFRVVESLIRIPGRLRGVARHPDPLKHFGPGGVEEAEAECARINRDLWAYLRPRGDSPVGGVERTALEESDGVGGERILFDSPLPSGHRANDRVELRLYRATGSTDGGPVVVFHHPVYQYNWKIWRWFVTPLVEHVRVAVMAAPYHFGRTPPGWFPGEGTINPNPVRLYEAIRQWVADQRAARRLLREESGIAPVATVGYSLGAFQTLLAASFGEELLPIVSIASTSRYAWGLQRGPLGKPIIRAMGRAGIDEARLERMVWAMQLERHVHGLRGRPVLFIHARFDEVDPPPSSARLQEALQPLRSVALPAGHASLALYRRRIASEAFDFLRRCGALDR